MSSPLRYRKSSGNLKYTDDEVLECLRVASKELGGVLTSVAYSDFARGRAFQDGRPWPTHQTAFLRLGSWRAALEAAGLQSNPSSAIAGRQLFDEAHCIDAILEVERAVGHLPSVREYEAYARKMEGMLPSSSTIRHRFGSWQRVLRRTAEFASSFEA
ncbi:MAG: homing endonuclease associated repeat-containing protein [bacterium]